MRTWIIIILIIAAFAVYMGCDSNSIPTAPSPVLRYVSVTVCGRCHVDKVTEWGMTGHSHALADLQASDHFAESCLPCHTVGLDEDPTNSGWDDPDPGAAALFGNVQCEACHGPGGNHVMDLIPLEKPLDAETCGACHDGAHHPTYTEWSGSAHATSNLVWQESSHFSAGCQECHAADYIMADSIPEDAEAEDFIYGITCVVCHDPHNDENEHQLRLPVAELCGQCHTSGDAVPGQSPHHPQLDILMGEGGYEYPGEEYTTSSHTFVSDGCAACHMWTAPFDELTNTAVSGHSFEPMVQACQVCHSTAITNFDSFGTQTAIQGLLNDLKAELDSATDNDKLTISYDRANFNYKFVNADGSRGIHNPRYTKKLLEDSIADFTPGS